MDYESLFMSTPQHHSSAFQSEYTMYKSMLQASVSILILSFIQESSADGHASSSCNSYTEDVPYINENGSGSCISNCICDCLCISNDECSGGPELHIIFIIIVSVFIAAGCIYMIGTRFSNHPSSEFCNRSSILTHARPQLANEPTSPQLHIYGRVAAEQAQIPPDSGLIVNNNYDYPTTPPSNPLSNIPINQNYTHHERDENPTFIVQQQRDGGDVTSPLRHRAAHTPTIKFQAASLNYMEDSSIYDSDPRSPSNLH